MIREATDNWTETVYRPLRRVGRRLSHEFATGAPRASRRPERYLALDNARFVLIALVVVGHLLEQLVNTGPLSDTLYRWIYLFHMPGFILISGALSKRTLTHRRLLGLATGLLVPYVIFQTLYPAWDALLFPGNDWSQGYLTPYWLLWYLPSLVCWRLMLPLFAHRWALPVAVAIALAAGLAPWIGYPFSLSRTLVFFPLFLLGHRIGAQQLQRLGASRGARVCAVVVLAAAGAGAWWLRGLDPQWLYASVGYATLNVDAVPGAAIRLALLAASSACALAAIALVPRRPLWAGFGRRSLTTYLMHGFLIRGLLAAGVFAWLSHEIVPPLQVLLCLACGALIAALFSTRFMDKLATPLTRPVRWLTPAGRTLARIRPRGWWAPARPSLAGPSPPRSQRTNRKHDASAIRRRME
jgi:fucose 4-O-acetylase-like acetyltransferase